MTNGYPTADLRVTPRRFNNGFVLVGDSRNASQFLDPSQNNQGNASWFNWMAGWLRAKGLPVQTLGNYAMSGMRSDQFAPQIQAAINTRARFAVMQGFLNDAAQNATVTNIVATMKNYIKAFNDNGMTAVLVWERGSAGLSGAQIGVVNDVNRYLLDFIHFGDVGDWRGPPDVIVLDPIPSTVVISSNGTIQLKNSQDGVHDNVAGAQAFGLYASGVMAPFMRPYAGHRLSSLNHSKSGLGVRSLIKQAGFTGSVAVTGAGNSGNVPTNCQDFQQGGATAAFTINPTVADADGNTWGNEVKLVANATSSGSVGLICSLDFTNIVAGDFIRGGMEIDVLSGATGLQGASLDLECFPSTNVPPPTYDMFATGLGNDPGGYSKFPLEPPKLFIQAFSGTPFTNLTLRLTFGGPGSATVICRKPLAERATQ
jgi:hypothetical protein